MIVAATCRLDRRDRGVNGRDLRPHDFRVRVIETSAEVNSWLDGKNAYAPSCWELGVLKRLRARARMRRVTKRPRARARMRQVPKRPRVGSSKRQTSRACRGLFPPVPPTFTPEWSTSTHE
ncbi:hypothetical protein Taro_029108 [Colocasia esculenta]|uniref:Uncharacterized protein n=1 Tax=Colocasia esculenta TaxID=4460 RepID=A0A843VN29_COLES|nr:hypothetical protein [Colocasia esculenta]